MKKQNHTSSVGTGSLRWFKVLAPVITAVLVLSLVSVVTVGHERTQDVEMTSIIIGFENEIDRELPERHGGELTRELEQLGAVAVDLPQNTAVDALNTWERKPNVDYVEVDGTMSTYEQEIPWGIDRIDAPEAQETSGGDGIDVAIVDTGIDPDHEDLDVTGGYAVEEARGPYDEDWADDDGHGTHCAGTAAALDNDVGVLGTAPDVDLWAVKVLDKQGSGSWSGVAEGIEWSADNDMEVISMSLGGGHSETVQDAVEYAYGEGSLMVAAAGNDYGDPVGYPAAYEEVIAVSATDEDDNIADFSNVGPEVELAAPGVDVLSTYPGDDYTTMSGTSMSTPHVSGVAAAVFDVLGLDASNDDPSDVDEVRTQLQETAEDIGLEEEEQGHGLVDAAEAVGAETEDVHDVTVSSFDVTDEVLQGESVDISANFENTGDFEETVEIEVRNDDTGEIFASEDTTLGIGETYEVNEIWETDEETDIGDHDIKAVIEAIEDGEVVAQDEALEVVTVREPEHEVAITEFSGDDVEQGETAEIDLTVENTGDYDYTGEDGVEILVTNDDTGEELLDEFIELETGEVYTDIVTWETDEDTEAADHTILGDVEAVKDGDVVATDSETTIVTVEEETEETDPEIVNFEVEDTSNPRWARVEVDWEVFDDDGNLDTVELEMVDDGDVVDSETIFVSGESASDTDELRERDGHGVEYEIVLTVTDTEGNSSTETTSIEL